ncbi:sulfotransferase domain-containing protein [Coleofasciculus sp. E1-EBD-02]|uniref:sulfotransferase domain-containing protein n=1 Tax=Coleofasciculus sp. E1-EBD-02 TaxID=3068481 RepID=UPI0032FA5173
MLKIYSYFWYNLNKRLSFSGNKKLPIKISYDNVFLVSYPKSGSTWVRFLIGNYLSGNRCDFTNSHLIVPDIHLNPEQCSQIQQPIFIKSHMPFRCDYRNVIYLVRDGRDVAVSYYFHLMKYRKISRNTLFADFIGKFNHGFFDDYTSWNSHVNSWINNAPNKFLLIKYENIKQNPLLQLIKILEFANISVNYDAATAAIESSKFEKMKTLEKAQHNMFYRLSDSDASIPFIRRGQVGNWKQFFTDDLMNEFIRVHGLALERLNYL